MYFYITDTNNFRWRIGDDVNGLSKLPIFPCMKIRIYDLSDYVGSILPGNNTISGIPYQADQTITVGSTIYVPLMISGYDLNVQNGIVLNGLYIEQSTGNIYFRIQNVTNSDKTITSFRVRVIFISKYSDSLMPQGYDS